MKFNTDREVKLTILFYAFPWQIIVPLVDGSDIEPTIDMNRDKVFD